MLIRVMYDNGLFDMVKPQLLDTLLETKKLSGFKRTNGWAVVGRDAIRSNRRSQSFQGRDRRAC